MPSTAAEYLEWLCLLVFGIWLGVESIVSLTLPGSEYFFALIAAIVAFYVSEFFWCRSKRLTFDGR